jgi:amino acid transporter
VTLLAWAGFGANGLSSACYGPEKAFLALGEHTELAPALALVTMLTVFLVAAAHAQLIKLFPSGGGSYRIAKELLGPGFGLVSGAALLIDYVLAVVVSVVSGTDAIFSVFPPAAQAYKLYLECGLTTGLILLNLRGMRESIALLLPIMIGFLLLHGGLIIYGIVMQSSHLVHAVSDSAQHAYTLSQTTGVGFTAAIFLRAYAFGGSTYTGVDAVSNNVHLLAEPRIRTGTRTSFYVALSLALTAGGLIFLYSLWPTHLSMSRTLNAVVFDAVIRQLPLTPGTADSILWLTLAFEGGLLLVAANSIFIFAPSLLGYMASDSWLPHRFRNLSNQLVRRNGIYFVGICALVLLVLTGGDVKSLLVLFSINVFLSLAISKMGLCRYWWRGRAENRLWPLRFTLAAVSFAITAGILILTLTGKFLDGGWVTCCLTLFVIGICIAIKRHYRWVKIKRREMDAIFHQVVESCEHAQPVAVDADLPTAIFFVTEHLGSAMHELLWVQRLFPDRFRNVVFVSVLEVDAKALGAADIRAATEEKVDKTLSALEHFCHANGIGTERFISHGVDPVDELHKLTLRVVGNYPDSVCFASKFILPVNRWITEWLHNQTTTALQHRLHLQAIPLVILAIALS